MDDALVVRRGERIGHRDRDLEEPFEVHTALRHQLIEATPLDLLHHQELPAVPFLDAVDGDDVGMVEGRHGGRLATETLETFPHASELGWKCLDGDAAPEPSVAGLVDHAHAARAELGDHLVGTDPGADQS